MLHMEEEEEEGDGEDGEDCHLFIFHPKYIILAMEFAGR